MCFRGMSYLPLLLVVVVTTTIFVTYILAIVEKDVTVYFPYISDTGTKPPESCIFSQFLNMGAALAMCTIYVRYKLVEALAGVEDRSLRIMNKIGITLGMISALGMSLVANFQETNVEPVHLTGAFLVFAVGVFYAFIQTALSYHMYPDFNGLYICRVRMAISLFSFVSMVICIAGAIVARIQMVPGTEKLKWKPDQPGFDAHIISTICEWVTGLVFLGFFFTFVRDFQKMKMEVRPVLHVRHLDEEPVYPDERTRLLA